MAGETVLAVDHLVKSFRIHQQKTNSLKQLIAARGRNRYEDFIAVNDVTFDVREGEVFGVIGQNGSGKSTVLQAIALLKQSLRTGSTSQELQLQGALVRLGRSEDVRYESASNDEIGFVVRTPNGEIKLSSPTIDGRDTLLLRCEGDSDDLIEQLQSGFQFIQADRITPAGHYQQASTPDRAKGWLA